MRLRSEPKNAFAMVICGSASMVWALRAQQKNIALQTKSQQKRAWFYTQKAVAASGAKTRHCAQNKDLVLGTENGLILGTHMPTMR